MAGLLIIPFLEELGLTAAVTGIAEELGLSQGIAAVAGTTATGLVAGEFAKPIDKKAIDYFNEHVKGTFTDYFNLASAAANKDTNYFLNRDRYRQTQVTEQAGTPKLNTPIVIPTVIIPKGLGSVTDSLSGIYSSKGEERFNNALGTIKIINNNKSTLTPSLNTPIVQTQTQTQKQADPYDFFQTSPRDLARYVIDLSRRLATTKNLKEATMDTLALEPEAYTLSQKVTNFLADKSLPNTEEFKKIKQVFNGRNINYNNFSIARNSQTKLIEVTGINEIGQSFVLPETTGFYLPSIPGTVFMGPMSRNNKLPTKDRVEDYFSFFHDVSWVNGPNRIGDLQFIARLSENMNRVLPQNRKLVSATIIYFANISLHLSMFVAQPEEDIFKVLGGVVPNDPNYEVMREEFYQVMTQELTSYSKTDGLFVTYKDDYVNDLINGIEVQLN